MNRHSGLELQQPVVAILRGVKADLFAALLPRAFAAGLDAMEVTLNTPGALEMVAGCRPGVPAGKYLGIGTIRNLAEAEQAVAGGAMFLVTPNLDPAVIEYGRSQQVPVIVGALTPTEVYGAWAAGAAMVKVFPCGAMGGAGYIRDLRGPFDRIPLLPVGGVSHDTAPAYLAAGARAVGVGASLFGKKALVDGDIDLAVANLKKFLRRCQTG
ncbi:MAG: hypothetical protein L3J03_02000 [Desulfobacterales bacterium]|nr:hypothetical protein [Desulfobacterales bacterium]